MGQMEQFAVLSALGTDRSGLVAELTRFLVERGVSVQESRMVTLGAEFGVMMLIAGPAAACERVRAEAASLGEALGLQVLAKTTRDPRLQRPAAAIPHEVTVEALDREGIVHAFSEELRRLELNIVSLDTSSFAAPFSGGTLFRMTAVVDVPPGKKLREVKERLVALADRENLDIEVKARA
jgi:glycine cleavage system transcriptional repressor